MSSQQELIEKIDSVSHIYLQRLYIENLASFSVIYVLRQLVSVNANIQNNIYSWTIVLTVQNFMVVFMYISGNVSVLVCSVLLIYLVGFFLGTE